MYVRFVATDDLDWRKDSALSCHGIFVAARLALKHFNKQDKKIAKSIFAWFNEYIPCPDWSKRQQGLWAKNCVSWWKINNRLAINRLRPLIKMLRRYNVVVRTIYSKSPGKIVYEDKYQVIAECKEFNPKDS